MLIVIIAEPAVGTGIYRNRAVIDQIRDINVLPIGVIGSSVLSDADTKTPVDV